MCSSDLVSSRGILRTFFGAPSSLVDDGPWQSTLEIGIGRDVESIEERLDLSRFGYRLLRSLLSGAPVDARTPALPPADLVVIGYAAASRPGRRRLPFERILTEWLEVAGERRQRLEAVLLEASENVVSRRWFASLGFDVRSHRLGELPAKLRDVFGA